MKTHEKSWNFYRSQLAGNPCAECLTCGQTYVYWETDDLEYHTEQHLFDLHGQCEGCEKWGYVNKYMECETCRTETETAK